MEEQSIHRYISKPDHRPIKALAGVIGFLRTQGKCYAHFVGNLRCYEDTTSLEIKLFVVFVARITTTNGWHLPNSARFFSKGNLLGTVP